MQSLLLLLFFLLLNYLTHAAVLKTPMSNNYPQIAVLGCDSQKANLYYDIERHVWVEHLVSSCVNSEETILEFCQQAYPSLRIANIVRLDTVLRFENWCELVSPIDENGNNIHRCKQGSGTEEVVQPFRCLYMGTQREELPVPGADCSANSIVGTGECLRAEKWQQLASLECNNKSMILNNSLMTLDWCGLAAFRGIEFICCPLKDVEIKKIIDDDYETNLDEKDNTLNEDDPIQELDTIPFSQSAVPSEELRRLEPQPQKPIVSDSTTAAPHRRILAMSLSSNEPNWMADYRRWNTDSAYFADDEDTTDYQDDNKSIVSKYQAAMNEHKRFTKDKEEFKRKYKEQIDALKSRWQTRQGELQSLANRDASSAQNQFEKSDKEFRQEYDILKQAASRERTRINELHETRLDMAINAAKEEANTKLKAAWNEIPIKTENLQEALYSYLHVLLRDRIHLVNRYERLRAIDPEQAKRKQSSIYERLRLIAERINDANSQLRQNPKLQTKIQPRIDILFSEYDEVNQAAEKLLLESGSKTISTSRPRLLPLGRDEKKIYPFSKKTITSTVTTTKSDDNNLEYDYATNDEYEEEDDDDDDNDEKSTSTTTSTDSDAVNYDQIESNDSEWDADTDSDGTFDVKIDSNNDDQNQQAFVNENDIRPLMPSKNNSVRRTSARAIFVTYLPYVFGILMVICLLIGALVFRCMIQRRAYRHGGKYEKNYVFTEVESCTPEEKALHALQINGYENPTYKFFETQTPKC